MALAEQVGRALWFVLLSEDAAWMGRVNDEFVGNPDLRMAAGVTDEREVPRVVAQNGADLLLVDHALARRSGILVAQDLARRLPSVRVYLVADRPSPELFEEVRRRGLRGVVRRPFDPPTLARLVREDMEFEARRADALRLGAGSGPGVPAAADPPPAEPRSLLAVFSPKGGVGKTTVALNLALAASLPTSRRRRGAVLVDAEEGVGSASAALGLVNRPTLLDWAEWRGERSVDPAIVARRLAEHRTGLRCVFAPGRADATVDGELMDTVLLVLRGLYPLVVVDCAPVVTPAVMSALAAATAVLVVVEPTLDCLQKTRETLRALAESGSPMSKYRVLVNTARPGEGSFTGPEVREALELPLLGLLPFEPLARRAVNRREPLAVHLPGCPFMQALTRALEGLLPGLGPRPAGGRRFAFRR